MSIINTMITRIGLLRNLIAVDIEAEQTVARQNHVRQDLDRRLVNIAKATVDGEEKWFLDLVKKDPGCAIEVIKECDLEQILIPEAIKVINDSEPNK